MTKTYPTTEEQPTNKELSIIHKTLEERAAEHNGILGLDGEDIWYEPLESEKW